MHMMTSRLLIRPVQAEDWPTILAIWADFKKSPLSQYDKPHSTDPEDVRTRIARWASFTAAGTEHMFFAVCAGEALIGYIAFNLRPDGHEIGYCFHSAYHGKGYAAEALRTLLVYLKKLGFRRFHAGTALNNTPSVRLLTSLGFRLTATEKVSFYQNPQGRDIFFDGGIFTLTLPDV